MDYKEAVKLACAGDQQGFQFLYEKTYKKKYYLALQYMKNEEAAQDVLQDAYLKAFSKLETLKEPEAFPSWLGLIVANTAKNTLAKKKPMLFSEMEEEEEDYEERLEDENIEYQPETAYTREETRQMVRELIDSLSEEQRFCILMFHIEDMSIKEIAETLGCSENTVKSRLKYGRDNLKTKAEELQKKGYKLYSVAPLPLFLYLLKRDLPSTAAEREFQIAGEQMAERVLASTGGREDMAVAGAQQAVNADMTAAKSGVMHTVAGKMAAAVVGIAVLGSAGIYGVTQMNKEPEPKVAESMEEVTSVIPKELVGNYSYVGSAGGARMSLAIEASGIASITEFSSGTGESVTYTFQMSEDHTVTVPQGVTAYLFQAEDIRNNRGFLYDSTEGKLYDASANEWVRVE